MKLSHQGVDLDVECTMTSDCECPFCVSCRFVIELLAKVLAIACENNSREHYNFLCMNADALFEGAKEHLVNASDNGGGCSLH
jgi:hypothetical protein